MEVVLLPAHLGIDLLDLEGDAQRRTLEHPFQELADRAEDFFAHATPRRQVAPMRDTQDDVDEPVVRVPVGDAETGSLRGARPRPADGKDTRSEGCLMDAVDQSLRPEPRPEAG